jgi:anti-sigma regulatory factor (Ser/Thr protein kinase)
MVPTRSQLCVTIADPTQVGEARRAAAKLSNRIGLDATTAGNAAIVVSELATNILRHAGSGEIMIGEAASARAATPAGRLASALDILALDRGPGMDIARCVSDGYSTTGTRGEGLGAVRRLSSQLHVWSRSGAGKNLDKSTGGGGGTIVHARVGGDAQANDACVGAVSVPYPGEIVCGDAWDVAAEQSAISIIVVDGLGHGAHAADAARAALEAFACDPYSAPQHIVMRCHQAMLHTRGGALAVARIDRSRSTLRFAGVGNIAGIVWSNGQTRGLMSHSGTVGAQMRQVRELESPWTEDSILVLHSDGLTSRWKLDDLAGITQQHPAVVAGALHRDFRRGRDDATVVVVTGSRADQ